jgi:hypothetical protein
MTFSSEASGDSIDVINPTKCQFFIEASDLFIEQPLNKKSNLLS